MESTTSSRFALKNQVLWPQRPTWRNDAWPAVDFVQKTTNRVMIGQIQLLDVEDIEAAERAIEAAKTDLMAFCNDVPSRMIALGGGCKGIEMRRLNTPLGTMLVVHLLVDCRDAMGANAVNTMAERVAPRLETLTGGEPICAFSPTLQAIDLLGSALCSHLKKWPLTAQERTAWPSSKAYWKHTPLPSKTRFRATTHNKGIMNAISSVALACGQDWRARGRLPCVDHHGRWPLHVNVHLGLRC